MVSGKGETLQNKTFTWQIEEFQETYMQIGISFENPSIISQDDLKDIALVSFYNTKAYL
jgi:chromosome segregation ATPase